MGIINDLKQGIFISDIALPKLNIEISQEMFNELKKQVNESNNPNEIKKCFLTGGEFYLKDGLMLDREWIANALEKTIESQEKLYDLFNEGYIMSNGKKIPHLNQDIYINDTKIKLKDYKKSVKLGYTKKFAFKALINQLREKK